MSEVLVTEGGQEARRLFSSISGHGKSWNFKGGIGISRDFLHDVTDQFFRHEYRSSCTSMKLYSAQRHPPQMARALSPFTIYKLELP